MAILGREGELSDTTFICVTGANTDRSVRRLNHLLHAHTLSCSLNVKLNQVKGRSCLSFSILKYAPLDK